MTVQESDSPNLQATLRALNGADCFRFERLSSINKTGLLELQGTGTRALEMALRRKAVVFGD